MIKYLIASVLLVFSLSASALQLNMAGCQFVASIAASGPDVKAHKIPKEDYLSQVMSSISQFLDEDQAKDFRRVLEILLDKTYDSKAPEQVIGQSVLDACVRAQGDTNKIVGVSI